MQKIKEFTTKDMSDLLYEDLSKVQDYHQEETNVVMQAPTAGSSFPCRFITTPLDTILKSENAVPVVKNFQITIEHWASEQEKCMEMASNTDVVLQKRNMLRTKTEPITYDEKIQKYQFITSYEVKWEALSNALKFVK